MICSHEIHLILKLETLSPAVSVSHEVQRHRSPLFVKKLLSLYGCLHHKRLRNDFLIR